MFKRLTATILALILLLLLSGCSVFSIEPENVLSVPHPAGDQQEIESLIASCANGSYTPVYPRAGDHKSSVLFEQIGGNGSPGAMAMYRTADDTLHLLFASGSGSSYSLITDISIDPDRGNEIDRVDFIDSDGDGLREVLVGLGTDSSALCSLVLFSIGQTVTAFDVPVVYNSLVTGDFNSDGCDDVLTLLLYAGDSIASARLMCSDAPGSLSEKSACELDTAVTTFADISTTVIKSNGIGAVIDGLDANNHYTTQLIYYDTGRGTLMNPLLVYSIFSTRRDTRLLSRDVNNDGVVEIPSLTQMEFPSLKDDTTVCDVIEWMTFDPTEMTGRIVRRDILCPDGSYMLNLPDDRYGVITARYDSENHIMTIYTLEYSDDGISAGDKLLSIHTYQKSAYDPNTIIEAVAGETGTMVFTYTIEDPSADGAYTDDEVIRSFSPASDI